MKTFVLFYLSLFGFLNNPSHENSNAECSTDSISECQQAAPIVPSTFQLLAGNTLANTFKKVLPHNGNYYVIGSSGIKASLHKFDDTGNLIWSREVNDTSSWNDFIVNESGNLLLVGSRDMNAGLPKDVLVGVYDPNGTTLQLNSYDYGINESYNSIVQNPLRTTPEFRYFVVGSINLTNNRNDDDVIVTSMTELGSSVGGLRRKYGSLNIDDEFHAKISVYDPLAGTFALCGSIGNTGTYVVINGGGTVTNLGRGLGTNVRLLDLQRTPNGEHLGSGYFYGSPAKGRIFKISPTPANTFVYESQFISGLSQILPLSSNSFYVVGETFLAGTSKPVTMLCNDNGPTLTLFKGKYPVTGDNFTIGKLSLMGLTDLAYVDGRINTADGFGQQDGYLATHIGSYEDCGQDSLGGAFNKISLTPVIAQPNSIVQTLKEPFSMTSQNLTYTARKICLNNCIVEFNTSNIDNCGNVQFTSFTNLPGTVSYCWDFGDIPPCGSTTASTSHNYNNAGIYQVCLTVSNGISTCQICNSINITNADHNPPAIQCPPNITVNCDESILPAITGSPTVTDNLDPSPVVTYTDFVIQMTSCYKEILRDWSATDYCGNVIHCQQTIVQSDIDGPVINCPGTISLDCNSSIGPDITGYPVVLSECQAVHNSTYSDMTVSTGCPTHIQRIWTVTDACGNNTQCLQNIFLFDNTPPILSGCNRKFIVQGQITGSGPCQAEVNISSPTVSDNCNVIPTLSNNFNNTADASGIYPEGTTLVTWTATDLCGNTATCVDTVCVLACLTNVDTCCKSIDNFLAMAGMPLDVIRDSCSVCISHPYLNSCQFMKIEWGDGNTSGYYSGAGPIDATHTYPASGEYQICIKYEERNLLGEVCFEKDSCFTVCVQCGICEREELALNCFSMFGESNAPIGLDGLANISDFYVEYNNLGQYYTTGHISSPSSYNECFVSKYNEDCEQCWNFLISGDLHDQGLILKHFTGGFYVAGISNSPNITIPGGGGTGQVFSNPSNERRIFLAKYNDTGNCDPFETPTLLWALIYGNNDYRALVSDMDLDSENNPILVGVFTGSLIFDYDVKPLPVTPSLPTSSGNYQDFYMVKFDQITGKQIWVRTLGISGTNTGGAYPNGVSVNANNEIYVAGAFSQIVDLDNSGTIDLSGGPNLPHSAPFVAKFIEIPGTAPMVAWAIPILGLGLPPYTRHGEATDVEATNTGCVISFEKFNPVPYEINPLGTSVLVYAPNETSFLVRYNSNGQHQCNKQLPLNNYINEISVDNNDKTYFIGGRNYFANGYTFHNTFFGVMDAACNIKEFNIDGNRNDDGWSIAPDNNGSFLIIGRTNSVDFNPDPYTSGSPYYTVSGSDPDIFIGKYSCECILSADTLNCCDNISISGNALANPDPLCIENPCCYSTTLHNDGGFSLKSATVNIITPGWSFGTTSVGSGLVVSGTSTTQIISNFDPSANLPGGSTSPFFDFCLSGLFGASDFPEIEFIWFEKLKDGGCIAVCRDTLKTNCIAPSCVSNCTNPVNIQIVCDPLDPNQYCLTFNVTNLSPFQATGVIIDIVGIGFGMHPCGIIGYSDPLEIDFNTALDPGNTSEQICVKLISAFPILSPQDLCFEFGLNFGDDSFCFQSEQFCYPIEPCCDPCEEVELVVNPLLEIRDSCCFSLDLVNPCSYLYFNKIVVDFLPTGSDISVDFVNGNWTLTPLSSGSVCLTYNAGYIPAGLLEDIFRFCYLDPVSGLMPSITVHFFSDIGIPPPSIPVEVCSKNAELKCNCCPECEKNIVLNGNFQDGLINGNLGGPGNVNNWNVLTGTPQAVDYFGSCENGAVLMWGNAIVGESIFQNVNFDPCYTYEISYCARRHFNDGQEYIGEIRMKAVTTPLPAFPDCVSGNCEEIIPLPNGLTPNWEHFTVTWTPDLAYNSLIIQPWSSTTINNGANVSWILIDDICIRVVDSCKCESHGELLVFNDQFSMTTSCNDPAVFEIPCPNNNVSFNIFSDLECSSDCASSIEWNITDPAFNVIVAGTIPLPAGGGSWGISGLPYSIFTEEVLYKLNINSICGCDTCVCVKTFKINACDTCCGPHDEFLNIAQNAIHINVDNFKCKAILTFDEVDCNIQIISVKWKTGAISYGPFVPGDMVMNTYPSGNVSYLVLVHVVEYNEFGIICNEADITYPVSLNCKKCCEKGLIEHKKWASLIAQGFQTNINGCEVTVTAPQFGDCYFFETSPDWGEPPAPVIGPFPSNSSWTHTYSTSGTYTICVRVSEYPFGDPTLEPCRSKLMCTTVTVDCNGPCVCDGFSNLSFYYDKENKQMTECGDTLTLECPPDDCVWIFSGNLLCKNDCPESLINWQLVDSYSGLVVASGTSVAFPGFGIYIPPAIVTAGGEYDLIMNGQCDPNVLCPCKIHLSFPGCDEVCPCDPDDLVNDVETGLSTYTILNGCTACFRPLALSDCDMVTWYKLPNLVQPIATSLGNQLICHDFLTPGTHRIKMEVIRKNEDGSVCATYEKLFTLNINCGSSPNFDDASTQCMFGSELPTYKNLNSWINIQGNAEHIIQTRGNSYVTLRGNMDQSDMISSREAVCVSNSSNMIQIDLNIKDANHIKLGTRLVIALLDPKLNISASQDKYQIIARIDLSKIPSGNIHVEQSIHLGQVLRNDDCEISDFSKFNIIVYLENDLPNQVIQSHSQIELYDLCITSKSKYSEDPNTPELYFSVFPNPTNDQFTFLMDQLPKEEIQVEVLDKLGRTVEQLKLKKEQTQFNFGAAYLSGMYFLKVKSGELNKQVKIVKSSK